MSKKTSRNGLLYVLGILTCALCSYLGSMRTDAGLLSVPKKTISKDSILNLCLKSRVVIELEYMSLLTLQHTIVVKTFLVFVKILGLKYSA